MILASAAAASTALAASAASLILASAAAASTALAASAAFLILASAAAASTALAASAAAFTSAAAAASSPPPPPRPPPARAAVHSGGIGPSSGPLPGLAGFPAPPHRFGATCPTLNMSAGSAPRASLMNASSSGIPCLSHVRMNESMIENTLAPSTVRSW